MSGLMDRVATIAEKKPEPKAAKERNSFVIHLDDSRADVLRSVADRQGGGKTAEDVALEAVVQFLDQCYAYMSKQVEPI